MDQELLVGREGALGHLSLNRPGAINALTLKMVRGIAAALDAWEEDPAVAAVMIDGEGERGLSAGADIAALRRSVLDNDGAAETFFREEYQLNARLAEFPKPVVVVMDGVVMGGGVGLSSHASHRLATERLAWAMPEVGIGFVPDVGGTLLLSRAPGELGTYLALTAGRATASDALFCGFADAFVSTEALPLLRRDLQAGRDVDRAVATAAARTGQAPPSALAAERFQIDACFAGDNADAIVERTRAAGRDHDLAALMKHSPTSIKVTLAGLRRACGLSLREALAAELQVVMATVATPDFAEGVRAMVIDKDRDPQWSPARLEEVDNAVIKRLLNGPSDLAALWSGSGRRSTSA